MEMAVCAAYQIPHSHFLGDGPQPDMRESIQAAVAELGEDTSVAELAAALAELAGRLGTSSPRWTSEDREKAIWWHLREQERCGSCGTRRAEWDEHRHAYSAKKIRCRGCEVKEGAEKSITKADGKGVRIELHRNQPKQQRGR